MLSTSTYRSTCAWVYWTTSPNWYNVVFNNCRLANWLWLVYRARSDCRHCHAQSHANLGQVVYLTVLWLPQKGTNVLDIYDPTGSHIIAERSARMLSVHMSPAANPDQCPLGMDVLGTCTCQCNNSDGHVAAYTACWELVVSDVHEHNTISIFFYLLCIYLCFVA